MRALVLIFAVAFGCGKSEAACEMPAVLADLAPEGAQDCGTVPAGGDATAVDACAVAAFQAGTPFFATYEEQGIDSAVSSAIVSDGTAVWTVYRDSDPSGGSQIGALVQRSACVEPTVAAGDAGHDVIVCNGSSGGSCAICGGDRGADNCQ